MKDLRLRQIGITIGVMFASVGALAGELITYKIETVIQGYSCPATINSMDLRVNPYGHKSEAFPNMFIIDQDKCVADRAEEVSIQSIDPEITQWMLSSTSRHLQKSGKKSYTPLSWISFGLSDKKNTATVDLGYLSSGGTPVPLPEQMQLSKEINPKIFLKAVYGRAMQSPFDMTLVQTSSHESGLVRFLLDIQKASMPTLDGTAVFMSLKFPQPDESIHTVKTLVRNWKVELALGEEPLTAHYLGGERPA